MCSILTLYKGHAMDLQLLLPLGCAANGFGSSSEDPDLHK